MGILLFAFIGGNVTNLFRITLSRAMALSGIKDLRNCIFWFLLNVD